jgi:hypothetical protein
LTIIFQNFNLERVKKTMPTIQEKIEKMVTEVEGKRPVLKRIIAEYGSLTLLQYAQKFRDNTAELIQSRDSLIAPFVNYTQQLLGAEVAENLKRRLELNPSILTANHHNPDFWWLTMQGTLLFSLAEEQDSVVPVLAFGNIPLSNSTYPRGIIVRDGRTAEGHEKKVKVNIFPDKEKNRIASVTPSYSADMIQNAMRACEKIQNPKLKEAMLSILNTIYLSEAALLPSSYGEQTTIVNYHLWKRLFQEETKMPELVFIEVEKVIEKVLEEDLKMEESLIYQLLFNQELRSIVIEKLDGAVGCWDLQKLAQLNDESLSKGDRRELKKACGTVFFWGIDSKGRQIPVLLSEKEGQCSLIGVDDSNEPFSHPYTPEAVLSGLKEGKLLTGLFSSFTPLTFARAFKCYGGMQQADYLTTMRAGIYESLAQVGRIEWAEKIIAIPTENYATGMKLVVTLDDDKEEYLRGADALDIIASGGLTQAQIEKLKSSITINDGNILGLPDVYRIVCGNDAANELNVREGNLYAERCKGRLVEI